MPRILHLAAAMALFSTTGCEPGDSPMAPVCGKVLYRGMPVRTGSIVFTPDALRGGSGPLASADLQPDGSFTLHTGERVGAVPGWHRVTILAVESGPAAGRGQRPRLLVPERYSDPDLSGLACEVKPGQENTVTFNLD
jgi:hypothetical protein